MSTKANTDNIRPPSCDVLIAGAGFVGLTLAIALRQGLGETFRVAVADPGFAKGRAADPRASAIAASARRLLEAIGVWGAVAARAQPILDMAITDSRLGDAIHPVFLTFAGEVAPGEPFAHMIENRDLVDTLLNAARRLGVGLEARAIDSFAVSGHDVTSRLGDKTVASRLLVAADGARSRLRELAGIACHGWSYPQSAIATTVGHERDHNGRAEEHFLPGGPFAILPLTGRRSSIVWTEEASAADRIIALPDDQFLGELEQRFGLHLGELTLAGPRQAYPLACRSPARSLPSAWHWSATQPMSFIRLPARD
jgi:2-octaprenyl-6-methoxyphenol hydroxylase